MAGMKGKLRLFIQLVVGFSILLWLLQMANLKDVSAIILQVNPLNLIAAACFFIIASTFVALALYVPLKHFIPKLSVFKVVMASFAGQLLSDVTPIRSGYFLTPLFLNGLANVPIEQGMTGVLTTGGVNSIIKVLMCLLGLMYFASFLPLSGEMINALIVGISLLLAGGVLLLLLMWERKIYDFTTKFGKLPLVGVKLQGFIKMFDGVQKEGRKIKGTLISVAILIFLSLLSNGIALYLIFVGVWDYSLKIIDFLFLASIASTLTYVPITIAGLGVQEAGYVILLSLLLKIPINTGYIEPGLMAFALISRILFTGTDIIGVGPLISIGLKPKN
ncbi:MAG: lysylphosphatidylglycerol synthase transmembrane domain-containing protein [Candidatus Bathyarchaeia archaeon]